MKCIMDGTSRNMLTELESRALQLWDLNGYHGLRYQRIKRETLAPSDLTRHGQHDESTHSSVSAFYLGAASAGSGTAGATTGGGILNGIAHVAKEQQQPQSRRMLGNGTNNGNTSNSGHHPNHSEAAALVALARINGGVDGTETDEATASAAGADDDDEPEDNDADDDEEDDDEDEGEGEVEMDNDDDEEGEFEEENSTPHVPATSTPDALPPSKRRKCELPNFGLDVMIGMIDQHSPPFADTTHPYQQRHLAATASAHKLQYGRNGSASSAAVYHRRSAAGRAGADGLDGSILIAESISKLADNVGHIADSIREISAAFTTTTQSAFELIRRQSEIIQTLIEK